MGKQLLGLDWISKERPLLLESMSGVDVRERCGSRRLADMNCRDKTSDISVPVLKQKAVVCVVRLSTKDGGGD